MMKTTTYFQIISFSLVAIFQVGCHEAVRSQKRNLAFSDTCKIKSNREYICEGKINNVPVTFNFVSLENNILKGRIMYGKLGETHLLIGTNFYLDSTFTLYQFEIGLPCTRRFTFKYVDCSSMKVTMFDKGKESNFDVNYHASGRGIELEKLRPIDGEYEFTDESGYRSLRVTQLSGTKIVLSAISIFKDTLTLGPDTLELKDKDATLWRNDGCAYRVSFCNNVAYLLIESARSCAPDYDPGNGLFIRVKSNIMGKDSSKYNEKYLKDLKDK
jgi:hypothetical protein